MKRHLDGRRISILGMEFAIPISRFDPNNIKWGLPRTGPFRKIIPFGYHDNQVTFNSLILVLEPMRVVAIDWDKNQIILEEAETISFMTKLEQFQRIVNTSIAENYGKWLCESEMPELGLLNPIQPWVRNRRVTLYLSSEPKNLSFYSESNKEVLSDKTLKPGDLIRTTVKLHGISLQMSHSDVWTGRSRIQHNMLELYKVT